MTVLVDLIRERRDIRFKPPAVKTRYQGCRGCGAHTQPRNGKGDAYAYCKACHPGAIERRWTREEVLPRHERAVHALRTAASSYDWSRTHARRLGGRALEHIANGGVGEGRGGRERSTRRRERA